MPGAQTIPILPCSSLSETSTFYRALGFQVTHEQTHPNPYMALQRDDVNLHFMGIAKLDPTKAYSCCLVVVPALDQLYEAFRAGLKSLYGKLPLQGLPRISRLREGAGRFTVVDVAGNSLIFVRRDAPDELETSRTHTPLGKALAVAQRLRDYKYDDRAAAKMLDVALRKHRDAEPIDRARALAARIELALVLGDDAAASAAKLELSALQLTDAERARYQDELAAAERVERLRDE